MGRLARETLPDLVALAGPSYSALQGQQESFREGGDLFVDDQLSEEELNLICGSYEVGHPGHPGISNFPPLCGFIYCFLDDTALLSWFPKANIWESCGYNVRHWNQACEDFYLRRRADIMQGSGPLSPSEWRQDVRMNRQAPKLIIQMNKAALLFLQSSQADFLTHGS